ncbi:MAG TPA: hypothetical protein GX705_04705, partial [Clostridiales bacterium]|nr:hypothetical protein [Clostridiales bacterium]
NQGRFLIEVDKDGGKIEATDKEAEIVISIANLVKLLFGETFINDVV